MEGSCILALPGLYELIPHVQGSWPSDVIGSTESPQTMANWVYNSIIMQLIFDRYPGVSLTTRQSSIWLMVFARSLPNCLRKGCKQFLYKSYLISNESLLLAHFNKTLDLNDKSSNISPPCIRTNLLHEDIVIDISYQLNYLVNQLLILL